jgi:hypothetical protein
MHVNRKHAQDFFLSFFGVFFLEVFFVDLLVAADRSLEVRLDFLSIFLPSIFFSSVFLLVFFLEVFFLVQ